VAEIIDCTPPARNRYDDAVTARRAELRAHRALLLGGHHSELRGHLALSRLAVASAATLALAALAAEAATHIEAGRAARERLPALLTEALAGLSAELHARWAGELVAPLRLAARRRGLAMPSGWPRLPRPGPPPAVGYPPSGRRPVRVALRGPAVWRLALLPPALLPLFGISMAGGPPTLPGRVLLPFACGLSLCGIGVAIGASCAALQRAGWRAHVDSALAIARATLDADLGRRVLELEQSAAADLDGAVGRRRAAVEAELAGLAADRTEVRGG
jgi:hypothetical protein